MSQNKGPRPVKASQAPQANKTYAPAAPASEKREEPVLSSSLPPIKIIQTNTHPNDNSLPHIHKDTILKVPGLHYLHVLDTNTNVVKLEVGPKTLTCLEHERVIFGPTKMVVVPPRYFCVVHNPIMKDEHGQVLVDKFRQARLKHGDTEIRLNQDPFPLYPGEIIDEDLLPLQVIPENVGLRLKASCDFIDRYELKDGHAVQRKAGDEWMFVGPATYIPQPEILVVETVGAVQIEENHALKLRARKDFVDRTRKQRKAGEVWIYYKTGPYLPDVNEDVVEEQAGIVLVEKEALHLKALNTFTDRYGKLRKAGEEWLVKLEDSEIHIVDVWEQLIGVERLISLTSNQYCKINNPVGADGKLMLGTSKQVKGPANFFLQPGEQLEYTKEVNILGPDQALLVQAREDFREVIQDGTRVREVSRRAGSRWLVYGPRSYVPPIAVDIKGWKHALIRLEGSNIYAIYDPPSFFGTLVLAIIVFFIAMKVISSFLPGAEPAAQ